MNMNWLKSLDRNEAAYWIGLAFLFIGLAVRVSIATALAVIGAILVIVSVLNSLILVWLSSRPLK